MRTLWTKWTKYRGRACFSYSLTEQLRLEQAWLSPFHRAALDLAEEDPGMKPVSLRRLRLRDRIGAPAPSEFPPRLPPENGPPCRDGHESKRQMCLRSRLAGRPQEWLPPLEQGSRRHPSVRGDTGQSVRPSRAAEICCRRVLFLQSRCGS